ncbi:MAG TPA: hypothetical protein VN677_03025 [Gemmatimonadaceae bacterium]|nr:hypothetical protein [Gemmatimonadaceae bacterium]
MRLDRGRFTVVAYPADVRLARALLDSATARDTFPGLPRPRTRALIAVAPDARRFRQWAGPAAPEWGAAIAVPDEQRIVMQGGNAGSDAGNPFRVLRHELAHLALHEYLGDRPPRWFDEGYASYAAAEWGRDDALATNLSLALHGVPSLDSLDAGFQSNVSRADASYALSYRAVADLASLDPERGLTLFFRYWKDTGSMDVAIRRAYGLTQSAFEAEWRSRTMHRYGILALLANVTVIMALLGFVIVPLYVVRMRRRRRALAALLAADAAAERAARASALAALLADGSPPDVPRESRQREPPS